MPGFTALGDNTKTTFLHTEAHKTTVEFICSAAVNAGQPVKLGTNGQIAPMGASDLQHLCIGIAYNTAAIGGYATVWTRGFAITYGLSNAIQGAGGVAWAAYDTTNAPTGNPGTLGYNKYKAMTDATDMIGWQLDNATAANQLVRILHKD